MNAGARAAMRRTGLAVIVAALAFGAGLPGARADEAKLPPMPRPLEDIAADKTSVSPETASMEAWGRTHPDCAEWTDNCQVCVAGDKTGCSTVGTACVRVAPTCRKLKTARQPSPVPVPAPRPQTEAPAPQQSAPATLPPAPITPAPKP